MNLSPRNITISHLRYGIGGVFFVLLTLGVFVWMNACGRTKGLGILAVGVNQDPGNPIRNRAIDRKIEEGRKFSFINYLMDGRMDLNAKDLLLKANEYEKEGDALGVITVFLMTRDKSLEEKLKRNVDKGKETLYALALCANSPSDRLVYSEKLKLAYPADSVANLLYFSNALNAGESSITSDQIVSALKTVDFSENTKSFEEKQREIVNDLGQASSLLCSTDTAEKSQLLDNMLVMISRFNAPQLGNSVESSPELRASASLEAIGKFREATRDSCSFSIQKRLCEAEIRTLEGLDPSTEYGDRGTVAERISEIGADLDRIARTQQAVSAALIQSSSVQIKSFEEQMKLHGIEKASEWLVGPIK